jgi:hypothetical protein
MTKVIAIMAVVMMFAVNSFGAVTSTPAFKLTTPTIVQQSVVQTEAKKAGEPVAKAIQKPASSAKKAKKATKVKK